MFKGATAICAAKETTVKFQKPAQRSKWDFKLENGMNKQNSKDSEIAQLIAKVK